MYTFRNPAGLSAASGKEMGNAPASRTSQRPKAIIVYCFSQKNLSFSPSFSPSVCGRKRGFSFFEDLSSVSPIRERCCFPSLCMRAPAILAALLPSSLLRPGDLFFSLYFPRGPVISSGRFAVFSQRSLWRAVFRQTGVLTSPPSFIGLWFMPFHKNKAADACGLLFPPLRLSSYRSNCRAYSHRWNTG